MKSICGYLLLVVALIGRTAGAHAADEQPADGQRYYTHEPPVDGLKPSAKAWSEVVGKRVQVEGVSLGQFEKGIGPYIVLENGTVYVDRALDAAELNGRLVRVTGKLVKQEFKKAAPGSQGFEKNFFVYTLIDAKVEKIDKAAWPWMRLAEKAPTER